MDKKRTAFSSSKLRSTDSHTFQTLIHRHVVSGLRDKFNARMFDHYNIIGFNKLCLCEVKAL